MVLCKDVHSETSWKQLLFYPDTWKTIYISKKAHFHWRLKIYRRRRLWKRFVWRSFAHTTVKSSVSSDYGINGMLAAYFTSNFAVCERQPGGTAPAMEFEAKDAEWNVIPTCFLIRAAAQIHKRGEREWGVAEKILCFLHEKVGHWSKTFS